ncbi:YadA family autotransporter adhesin [Burkholderia cepacia]|uniref:YadA family autotransporter adhesin n=1 Tax=Burkholderia cepacia TaxID=292 RepID=UPI001FC816BC|nr:YadA-like family protein [Burkholderia cepacia]
MDTTATGTCAKAGSSTAVASGATAYGSQANAASTNATAVGFRSTAVQAGSVAIGYQAQATGDPTTAIGSNSTAAGNNSVALGADATAVGNNSVALGNNSVASQDNTVSVGTPGNERRITNIAPGVNATDAVNMSQLNSLSNSVSTLRTDMYGATAASMAMAGLPQPYAPGQYGMTAGAGTYHGQSALAVGFSGITADGKWVVKMSGSVDTRGGIGASAGVFHPF